MTNRREGVTIKNPSISASAVVFRSSAVVRVAKFL